METAAQPVRKEARFDYKAALPRLRSDLRISRQIYRNKVSFVIKDPVALKYYRIGELEMYFGGLLNGKRTMEEVFDKIRVEFPWEQVDIERLEETFRLFFQLSLLHADPLLTTRVYDAQRNQVKKPSKTLGEIAGLLFYYKVPLCDPDLLLFRMDRWLGFLWSPLFLAFEIVMVSIAIWTVLNNMPKIHASFGNLLTLHNLFLLWVTTMTVKVFHEFGHGLSCKHFGGEVHEMGAAFILLSPFLFCDATDSWMFAKKRRKVIVTMGGIYIELLIASVAALVWANTDRSIVNQLAYNVMIVASITTVLFNANPLMRFDGYYALSDLMDVPNLREKARRYLLSCVTTATTGGAPTPDMVEIAEEGLPRRIAFTLFAIASYCYTYFIVFRVIKIVGARLEPIGLAKWGQAVEVSFCSMGIILPIYAFARELHMRYRKDPSSVVNMRLFKGIGISGAVVAAILLCPWTISVTTPFVLYDGNRAMIHTDFPGFLRQITVKTGDTVKAGQLLAILENDELQNKRQAVDDSIKENVVQRRIASAAEDSGAMQEDRSQDGDLAAAKRLVDKDCAELTLRSPINGIVGTEDLQSRLGEYMMPGDVLCEIIPEKRLEVRIALTEREAGLVKTGQTLEFRTYAFPSRVFSGTVSKIFSAVSESLPSDALAARSGGDVPTALDPEGHEHPVLPTFLAQLSIDNPDGLLRPGMSGRGKIVCGHTRLGIVLYQRIGELAKSIL